MLDINLQGLLYSFKAREIAQDAQIKNSLMGILETIKAHALGGEFEIEVCPNPALNADLLKILEDRLGYKVVKTAASMYGRPFYRISWH